LGGAGVKRDTYASLVVDGHRPLGEIAQNIGGKGNTGELVANRGIRRKAQKGGDTAVACIQKKRGLNLRGNQLGVHKTNRTMTTDNSQ